MNKKLNILLEACEDPTIIFLLLLATCIIIALILSKVKKNLFQNFKLGCKSIFLVVGRYIIFKINKII